MSKILIVASFALLSAPSAFCQSGIPAEQPVRGKVLETMDSGGYTYVRIETGNTNLWAAGYPAKVTVGQTVSIPEGLLMTGFQSSSLKRTFPEIRFVAAIDTNASATATTLPAGHPAMGGAGGLPAGHPSIDGQSDMQGGGLPPGHPKIGGDSMPGGAGGLPSGHPSIGGKTATAPATVTESIPQPAGGTAIDQIHARRAELKGKALTVRGKVVKVTNGILDRNWVHIQDGAGKEHDLTVTTDGTFTIGETVTVSGTVAVDQDFGSGYFYDVVLEKAAIAK